MAWCDNRECPENACGCDDGEESGEDVEEVSRLQLRVEELIAMNNAARKATTMQHRIRLWADSLWPDRTVRNRLHKFAQEAFELDLHRHRDNLPPENLREEAADCAIVLFDLAAVAEFDLLDAIAAKMAKNLEKHGGTWK